MLNVSAFGWFHTVLGLIAVVAGFTALIRHHEIGMGTRPGKWFFWFTVATCLTSFFIFRHGGFGKPHMLSVLTLVVLAIAWFAERRAARGGFARYAAVVLFLLALFFHFIPGFTETLIRVPVGNPWASGIEDPKLARLIGFAFLFFLAGAVWQVIRVRSASRQGRPISLG